MGTPAGSYQLGIDLGTTYTAAAVARDGQVEMVGLGNRAAAIPSVIHLAPDGTILTGEAASRRAATEPERVAREFKRRIGDPTPVLVGGTPYSSEALTAKLLRWVIERVSELEGGPPSHLALTHPANWGPYKQDLFGQSIRLAGATATTLTEPEAAAIAYAANERVQRGALIAVYDLGGGTFDAAVLRKTGDGFAILGQPEGIERLGGIDFDEAVVAHVRGALGGALEQIDVADDAAMAALGRLRRECVEAKEALSGDTETAISVLLPNVQTDVRLTRGEFEHMIRPTLTQTVEALRRALGSASVEPGQITAVLLVGGSSRIPLVSELVSDAFGRPVAVDAHPKHAIALGAAHAAALQAARTATPPDETVVPLAVGAPIAGTAHAFAASDTLVGAPADTQRAANGAGGSSTDQTIYSTRSTPPAATRTDQFNAAPWDGRGTADEVPAWSPAQSGKRERSRALWAVVAVVAVLALLGGGGAAAMVLANARAGDDTQDEAEGGAPEADGAGAGSDTDAEGQGDSGQDANADADADGDAGEAAGTDRDTNADQDTDQDTDAAEDTDDRAAPGALAVAIDSIALDGDTYVVAYTTREYEEQLPGQHVHFFFNTVPPEQAGVPGDGPWVLYGGPSPFTGYSAADRPADATQMCALVANPDHSVIPGSGACRDLPS